MKRRELERHLRAHGCRQVDEGGNHARWAGLHGERSVVPRHREIDYGLTRKICRQLQVPPRHRRIGVLDLRGRVRWEGDLDESRRGRS
jgi:mRNA interferase HicA